MAKACPCHPAPAPGAPLPWPCRMCAAIQLQTGDVIRGSGLIRGHNPCWDIVVKRVVPFYTDRSFVVQQTYLQGGEQSTEVVAFSLRGTGALELVTAHNFSDQAPGGDQAAVRSVALCRKKCLRAAVYFWRRLPTSARITANVSPPPHPP